MSIECMSLVWKYSKQKGTLLLLELALADYADERNIAWPSISTLARKIRMSRRYTIGMIEKLEASKEIKVIQAGDPTHSNHYLLMIKPTKNKGGEAGLTSDAGLTSETESTSVVKRGALGSEAESTRVVRRASEGSEAGLTLTTKNHQITTNESINQPPPPQESEVASDTKSQLVVAAAGLGYGWSLESLLDSGKVYKKRREAIPANASATTYVSNYLYALTQKGFNKPPSFWAAARLCEGKPAGEPFDELAELAPDRLASLLRWSADPYAVALDGDEALALRWRGAWPKGVDAEKVKQSLSDLGLTVFAPASAPEPVPQETTDLDRWCDVVGGMRSHRQMFQHLSAARFLEASNGAVRILVADERIKASIETAMPVIAPSLSKLFGANVLAVEVREA